MTVFILGPPLDSPKYQYEVQHEDIDPDIDFDTAGSAHGAR